MHRVSFMFIQSVYEDDSKTAAAMKTNKFCSDLKKKKKYYLKMNRIEKWQFQMPIYKSRLEKKPHSRRKVVTFIIQNKVLAPNL